MKKLVLMFAAVAAISFASCDSKKADAPAEGTDTTATVDTADTNKVDTPNVEKVDTPNVEKVDTPNVEKK